jgi:VanZ family protein
MVVAWAVAIFAVSATPGSQLPGGFAFQGHFIGYATFAALLFGALRLDHPDAASAVLSVVIASAYGVTDEIHQAFVPMRTPDVLDWAMDTVGAIAGATLSVLVVRLRAMLSQ